ncbi:MAG: ATP-dependent sacrificial sulfur transferase LarE [Candidatus Thorarchaeota archaeon]|nr:ATP-dependent sacrificial sulfur transferase LarE [Candidatus Thorarchaeota archaeon]
MKDRTRNKFDAIREKLSGKNVLVAFSGGVDSTVLASVVSETAARTTLLTITSATVPEREVASAISIAERLGLDLIMKDLDWLSYEGLAANRADRCYSCKQILASMWIETARSMGLDIVVEGTTSSETEGYRPGLKALEESGVQSPFLNAAITKEEIREYARERGLSVADKPSMACLATRFPYGTKIDLDRLRMVDTVEQAVVDIFGVRCVRARYHGNLVRIEVGEDELNLMFDITKLNQIEQIARKVGFTYVTLDLRGYRTGAMDENLVL